MSLKTFLDKTEKIKKETRKKVEKKQNDPNHDESNWLMAYADLMTLLVAFFAMMFSMSKLNAPEYERMKEQLAKHFGSDYENPTGEVKRVISQVIEQNGLEGETVIQQTPSEIQVALKSTIFFDTLNAELSERGNSVLGRLVDAVKKKQDKEKKEYKIVVEGHTDSRPVTAGIYPSNWELSSARAAKVVRKFLDNGFSSKNVVPIGYAGSRPVVPERTPLGTFDEDALGKNRRVVIRILDARSDSIPWDHAETSAH